MKTKFEFLIFVAILIILDITGFTKRTKLKWLLFVASLTIGDITALPTITQNGTEVTFSTSSVTPELECVDTSDITWFFYNPYEEDTIPIRNILNSEKDGRFVSKLTIPIAHQFVGYYYCVYTNYLDELTKDFPDVPTTLQDLYEQHNASRIYVFLDFVNVSLSVTDEIYLTGMVNTTLEIPCLPTRKNIAVSIRKDDQELSLDFNPKSGFILYVSSKDDEGSYECRYNQSDSTIVNIHNIVSDPPVPSRPSIKTSYHGKFVHESEKIKLTCTTDDPSLKLTWILPVNRTYRTQNHFNDDQNLKSKVLIIDNLTKADTGRYMCAVTNQHNISSSIGIDVTVFEGKQCHINITEPNSQYTIAVKGNEKSVQWVVNYDGYPKPLRVDWFDTHNRPILMEPEKFSLSTQVNEHLGGFSHFTIKNPTIADSGTYVMCVHGNTSDCQQSKEFQLIVSDKPAVDVGSAVVLIGQTANVSCSVRSYPASTIRWTWSECPLSVERPANVSWPTIDTCVERSVINSSYTLDRNETHQAWSFSFVPTVPGRLTCSAENTISANVATIGSGAIYILDRDAQRIEPGVALADEQFELVCLVDAYNYTDDALRWYRNGSELMATAGKLDIVGKRLQYMHQSTLRFESIQESNAGDYECVAADLEGKILKQNMKVIVHRENQQSKKWIIFLLLLLVLTIGIGFFFWRREHKKWLLLRKAGITYFNDGEMTNVIASLSSLDNADLLPYNDKFEVPSDRLRLSDVKLGTGAFGVVHKATITTNAPDSKEKQVAVKSTRNPDNDEQFKATISELKIMIHMGKHVNVVNLLGAVTRNIRKRVLYVITEFCDEGNLYQFVLQNRGNFVNQVENVFSQIDSSILTVQEQINEEPTDPAPDSSKYLIKPKTQIGLESKVQRPDIPQTTYVNITARNTITTITTSDLVYWSYQVANGMAFLAERSVLHGDLSARKILLCSNGLVKICDFGLSRSMKANENDLPNNSTPSKWLAIESITRRVFNTYSDIWSFGIFMWELLSLMEVPYADVPDDQLLNRLQKGYRMPRPRYANQALAKLIGECWFENPIQRLPFESLALRLRAMLPTVMTEKYTNISEQFKKENEDIGIYLNAMKPENEYTTRAGGFNDAGGSEMVPMLLMGAKKPIPLTHVDTDSDSSGQSAD